VEVVASLFQGRTAAAQCGLFTYKSVPVIFEPPCTQIHSYVSLTHVLVRHAKYELRESKASITKRVLTQIQG